MRVSIEFVADHHTSNNYDRALTFVGRATVVGAIAAKSSTTISTTINPVRHIGGHILVSPTALTILDPPRD